MRRKSSIHIAQGNPGFLSHNDRSRPTKNSIFRDEKNEVDHPHDEAFAIYRDELRKRSAAYTERTGQKMQKKTVTHLSAVINLEARHTLEDLKPLIEYIENALDTKIIQVAIHRDEGHIDPDTGKPIKNYHAHIEMMGIDSRGRSIRRKLTRSFLRDLQSKTAEILGMERGELGSRRRRLDTYEFKAAKAAEEEAVKKTKAEHALTVAQLKKEISELRKEMIGAKKFTKEDYDALAKIKKLAKKETLAEAAEEFERFKARIKEMEAKITISEIKTERLEERIDELKAKIEAKTEKIEELEAEVYSDLKYKDGTPAKWSDVGQHYRKLYINLKKKKEAEIAQLKAEKEREEERRKKAEEEAAKRKEEAERLKAERNSRTTSYGRVNPLYVERIEAENEKLKEENAWLKDTITKIATKMSEAWPTMRPKQMFKDLQEGVGKLIKLVGYMVDGYISQGQRVNELEEKIEELRQNEDDQWGHGMRF